MLDSARLQWEDGSRRLAGEADDPIRYAQLCELVGTVIDELRRRIGGHFTLGQLAVAHSAADDWVRDIVARSLPEEPRVGTRDAALVQDAAFHAYARGAEDWRP